MFYSKKTNGFYAREIHGDNIPSDAVEITYELYKKLLEGQIEGKIITSDINGFPVLQDRPQPKVLSVTARQARLALLSAGLLSAVESAIAQEGGDVAIEWEYASTIERASPLVASIASSLGLTETQLDELFAQASTL